MYAILIFNVDVICALVISTMVANAVDFSKESSNFLMLFPSLSNVIIVSNQLSLELNVQGYQDVCMVLPRVQVPSMSLGCKPIPDCHGLLFEG